MKRIGISALPANVLREKENIINKDRAIGSAKQAKGAIKEAADKVLSDAKLMAYGKKDMVDKVDGKVQIAIGGIKDAIKI